MTNKQMDPGKTQNLTEPPGVIRPVQSRSRQAQDRILKAFDALLRRHDYGNISITDVAQKARVATGSIYNRFLSKDHMLLALAEKTLTQDIDARYLKQDSPHWERGMDVATFLESWFYIVSAPTREYRHVLRPLALIRHEIKDEAFKDFLAARDQKINKHLKKILAERVYKKNPDVPDTALDFATIWIRTGLEKHLLFDEGLSNPGGAGGDFYLNELAKAIGAYLETVKPQRP